MGLTSANNIVAALRTTRNGSTDAPHQGRNDENQRSGRLQCEMLVFLQDHGKTPHDRRLLRAKRNVLPTGREKLNWSMTLPRKILLGSPTMEMLGRLQQGNYRKDPQLARPRITFQPSALCRQGSSPLAGTRTSAASGYCGSLITSPPLEVLRARQVLMLMLF